MSDIRYDTYQHYGTNAERLAFVPAPPSAAISQPIYIWFETDTLTTWLYYTSWVQIGGSGAGGISTAAVTLTNAQILALPTTAIDIVAAPGAGFFNQLISASIAIDASAGAYTNVDTGTDDTNLPYIVLASAAGSWVTSGIYNAANWLDPNGNPVGNLTSLLGFALSKVVRFIPSTLHDYYATGWGLNPFPDALSDHENQAIQIAASNAAAGNWTGGNAANTAVVTVAYLKVAVP